LVERFVYTEDVGSSSLSSPTTSCLVIFFLNDAGTAGRRLRATVPAGFFGQRPQDHDLKVAAGRVTWETNLLDLSRAIGK
jgi:hypothetical protein